MIEVIVQRPPEAEKDERSLGHTSESEADEVQDNHSDPNELEGKGMNLTHLASVRDNERNSWMTFLWTRIALHQKVAHGTGRIGPRMD